MNGVLQDNKTHKARARKRAQRRRAARGGNDLGNDERRVTPTQRRRNDCDRLEDIAEKPQRRHAAARIRAKQSVAIRRCWRLQVTENSAFARNWPLLTAVWSLGYFAQVPVI